MVFGWFQKEKSAALRHGKGAEPTYETTVAADLPDAALGKAVVGDSELLRRQRASLQEVIRECMIASGILSAGYKFKIFSADATHQQFLVLFDLAPEFATDTFRLTEMEAVIQATAHRRFQLQVKSCYWRVAPDPNAAKPVHPPAAEPQTPPQPEPKSVLEQDIRELAKAQLAELFGNNAPAVSPNRETEFPSTVLTSGGVPVLPPSTAGASQKAAAPAPKGYEDTELASQFKTTILQRKD